MSWIAAATILASLVFLAYRSDKMSWNRLASWLYPTTESQARPAAAVGDEADDQNEGDATPKVEPADAQRAADVPTFTLSDDAQQKEAAAAQSPPTAPSFPAPNSAQRASNGSPMAPPPRPSQLGSGAGSANSMPPPPVRSPPSGRATPSSSAASLRIPSTGPLPNRGPPANSQQRITASLTATSTAKSVPNPRAKVLLSPGHSPMDWAALARNPATNLSGVPRYLRVAPSQLKAMTGRKGKPAWSSWQGKVYNITPYLPFHPGGESELMKAAGRDGEKLFMEVHPWVNWENMLGACLVGMLVSEGGGEGQRESELEGLD